MRMIMQLKILHSKPPNTFCIADYHFATITCGNNFFFFDMQTINRLKINWTRRPNLIHP